MNFSSNLTLKNGVNILICINRYKLEQYIIINYVILQWLKPVGRLVSNSLGKGTPKC